MEDKAKEMYHRIWKRAQALEDRRQSGLARLKSFSIFTRIILFPRFSKIRKIIHSREMERSALVAMALGMVRHLKLHNRKKAKRK